MLGKMKIEIKCHAKRAMQVLENAYRIEPSASRQVRWISSENYQRMVCIDTAHCVGTGLGEMEKEAQEEALKDCHKEGELPLSDMSSSVLQLLAESERPNWRVGERITCEGVCEVDNAKIWVMRPSALRMRYEKERKAIIFNRFFRPVRCPGLPHLWVFITSYDWSRLKEVKKEANSLFGRVGVLGNHGFDTRNYYHFWADTMADLWFLRRMLPASMMPDHYLVHFAGLPWQWEILNMCGVERRQVLPMPDHEFLKVETCIVPIRDKGSEALPPWLASAIRNIAGWQSGRSLPTRRIYISRADAPRRRVINEKAVCVLLKEAGFQIYTLNGLSVRQQQSLFSSASVVFASHGAALTNLVWCQPETLVVDFLHEEYLVPCFQELSRQSGLNYLPVVCQPGESKGRVFEQDIIIPEAQVTAICQNIVKSEKSAAWLQ